MAADLLSQEEYKIYINDMLELKCKQCRREGQKLLLKGERCAGVKCAMVRKPYAPGPHGKNRRKQVSEYGKQLREKQKVKSIYGIMEKQFSNYFGKVSSKKGVTGDMLLQQLELRLDNLVYRAGIAASRAQARQLVGHGFFYVNGRKVNIPSFGVCVGDKIQINEHKKDKKFIETIMPAFKKAEDKSWFATNKETGVIEIKSLPAPTDFEEGLNMALIVEFYSR